MWNLDDNVFVQKISFVLTVVCWLTWTFMSLIIVVFREEFAVGSTVTAVNSDPKTGSQYSVLGMILFNFSFVTTVPSWVNEKHASVSINKSLWGSTFVCMVVFVIVGLPGAFAFRDVLKGPVSNTCVRKLADPTFTCKSTLMALLADAESLPAPLRDSAIARIMGKFSAYAFPLVSVASTIPVISIVVRYNMIDNGFSKSFSLFWGVFLPWLIAFPLVYMPNFIAEFINFTSLIFITVTDFVVPLLIYRKVQQIEDARFDSETDDQDDAPAGVHVHNAFPLEWEISSKIKQYCAVIIVTFLSAAALVVLVQAAFQDSATLDAADCADVGS